MSKREHKKDDAQGQEHDGPAQIQPRDPMQLALQRKLKERDPIVQGVRAELSTQADNAAQVLSLGANVFQMTVRGLDEAQLNEQLHPDKGATIAHTVIGQIEHKVKDGLVKVSGIGSDIAGKASTVFGLIKGTVEKRIAGEAKLTKLKLADIVSSTLVDSALKLGASLKAAIAQLPPEKILSIGKVLDAAEGGKDTDPDDSPERGNLGQGMRQWAMTELIGLPAGDLVAAEDIAVTAFTSFQSQVASAGTAAEQTDHAQHAMQHPNEPKERVQAAEAQMGPEFQKQMERDKTLRGRVDQVKP